jgi:hypothetical protein
MRKLTNCVRQLSSLSVNKIQQKNKKARKINILHLSPLSILLSPHLPRHLSEIQNKRLSNLRASHNVWIFKNPLSKN